MKKTVALKMTCLFLAIVMIFGSFVSCKEEDNGDVYKDKVDVTGSGLHISESGWITLNGKPFYGMGFVFKEAFRMRLNDPSEDLEVYFKKLREGGIPFVVISFSPNTEEEFSKYENSKDDYFAAMDYVVSVAEKYKIGIVATLTESLQAFVAHKETNIRDFCMDKTNAAYILAEGYVKDVVGRYKDSKSVWAWEIAEEANLLCEAYKYERTFTDGTTYLSTFTTNLLTNYYKNISAAIREKDSYRMISGGDGTPRFFSKALRDNFYTAPWDTYEDTKETFELLAGENIDCLSLDTPYIKFLERYKGCAKDLKKGLFVRSFCGTLFTNLDDSIMPEDNVYEANERESFNAYCDAYLEYGIQMAAVKSFASYKVDPADDSSVEVGTTEGIIRNQYVWERITAINKDYAENGKYQGSDYWTE